MKTKLWLARDKGHDKDRVYIYYEKPEWKEGLEDFHGLRRGFLFESVVGYIFNQKLKPGECVQVTITVEPIASSGGKLK